MMRRLLAGTRKHQAILERSQSRPHRCDGLARFWVLPSFLRHSRLLQRRVGGMVIEPEGAFTRLTMPTGDVVYTPGTSETSIYDAARTYFYTWYLDQYFQHTALRPGDVVVDIGAHIGCAAVPAARAVGPAGHVYACEAIPSISMALRHTVAASGLDNITVLNYGLGSAPGEATFLARGAGSGHSDLGGSVGEPVTVPMTTLDALVAEVGLQRLDFLKVDVEGWEPEVLRGAAQTIRRHRPVIEIAAYHKPDDLQVLPTMLREIEPAYELTWDPHATWADLDIIARVP